MASMSLFETGFAVDAHQPASNASNEARKRKRPATEESKAAQAAQVAINIEKLMKQLEESNDGDEGTSKKKKQKQQQQSKGEKEKKADHDGASALVGKKEKQQSVKSTVTKPKGEQDNSKKDREAIRTPSTSKAAAEISHEEEPKLSKKEKKKLKAEASKAAYTPTEADIAKREERRKKKEEKGSKAAREDKEVEEVNAEVEVQTSMDVDGPSSVPASGPSSSHSASQPSPAMTQLQKSMQKKLGGARFRWINEQLYTTSGERAFELMREDPSMFDEYHSGFRSQAASWPSQPINLFIDSFNKPPSSSSSGTSNGKPVIADLGCGDAQLAKSLVPKGFTVLSYDLISKNDWVVEAQCSKHIPLPGSNSDDEKGLGGSVVDAVVCCLSLMGHDWINMVKEARRITKMGGKLKIAEVSSRFTDIDAFIELIKEQGFKLDSKDTSNTHFAMFEFTKVPKKAASTSAKKGKGKETKDAEGSQESLLERSAKLLKPCLYKKR